MLELIINIVHMMDCLHLREHVLIIQKEAMYGQFKLVVHHLIIAIYALHNLILIQ